MAARNALQLLPGHMPKRRENKQSCQGVKLSQVLDSLLAARRRGRPCTSFVGSICVSQTLRGTGTGKRVLKSSVLTWATGNPLAQVWTYLLQKHHCHASCSLIQTFEFEV